MARSVSRTFDRARRLVGTLGLVLASIAFAAPAVNAARDAPVAGGCGTWQTVGSVAGSIRLTAVAAVASDDVWAAGQTAGGGLRVTIEHWDGVAWSAVAVPPSSVWQGINGLTAVAADDVWAVGYASIGHKGPPFVPLIEHWDGTTWRVVPSPVPAGAGSSALVSVDADPSGGLIAVGYAEFGGHKQTLIETRHGSAWRIVPSPSPGTEADGLLDVVALSHSRAFAVGYRSNGFGYRTLAERWNGSTWSVERSASHADVDNVLTGVAAAPGGAPWSIGYRIGSRWGTSTHRTLVERHFDRGWRSLPSPDGVGEINLLDGVAFSSANDGWAVGARFAGGAYGYRALIEHWDGTAWTLAAPDGDPTPYQRLRAVASVPGTGEAWAVGSIGVGGLIEHYCPVGSPTAIPPTATTRTSVDRSAPPVRSPPIARTVDRSPRVRASDAAVAVHAVDMASSAGIAQMTRTYGGAVTDLNGDGSPDIAISGAKDPAHVYVNDGAGHFSESSTPAFRHLYRLGCSWADVNADGRPDLFCAMSADSGTDFKANELWIQQPDHSFVNQAAAYGVTDPFGRGRHGVFVDVNSDGYPDLWIGNDNERPDGLPSENRLLINRGGVRFVDTPSFGLDTDAGAGLSPAADLTGDGFPDLVTTSGGQLHVYRNDGGTGMTDVTSALGLPLHLNDVWLGDMNGDGRTDLVGSTGHRLDVILQRPDGQFARSFHLVGLDNAVGVSAGDVNADGAPDLYIVQGLHDGSNAPDLLLLNGGDGKSFTPMAIPETNLGAGDQAVPLDYDGNGLDDFLVLNGRPWPHSGPVQLIAFFPAASR